MPYYVFRIQAGPTAIVKQLELLKEFEVYKEAQDFAKHTRAEQTDNSQIKVMFAENQLQAEEQLMEKRDKPILREWEK
ncbi:MAG: hypothetical protein GC149_03920 [Gammaproteobacteria bacterium]|nr:hypothetical protein [Gammaproteobacteria bacterium]